MMTTECAIMDCKHALPDVAMRRVRVMIVEDSRTIREFLTHIIASDPRLEMVAAVASGEEAMRVIHLAAPDVISMDIRLPGMDGLQTTRLIMAERPTPIVVVAADAGTTESKISIDALLAGALVVLEKPRAGTHEDYEIFAERVCTQLAIMSQVKVVTRRDCNRLTDKAPHRPQMMTSLPSIPASCDIIGVVASTGGPHALVEILNGLDKQFPVPILLVQHMTSGFARAFTEWLDGVCPLHAVEAVNGQRPEPGRIYTPPPDRHLALRDGKIRIEHGPLVSMQRPSGTVLFQSMAECLGHSAAGVLLTGMGDDGAAGLKAIRQAGGHTIAEHESTAVVYGMPSAAVAIGGVTESLPLHFISQRLRQLAGCRWRKAGQP